MDAAFAAGINFIGEQFLLVEALNLSIQIWGFDTLALVLF
jgi:hypothetical protein